MKRNRDVNGMPILAREYGEDLSGLIPIDRERRRCPMRGIRSCRSCFGQNEECEHLVDYGRVCAQTATPVVVMCSAVK